MTRIHEKHCLFVLSLLTLLLLLSLDTTTTSSSMAAAAEVVVPPRKYILNFTTAITSTPTASSTDTSARSVVFSVTLAVDRDCSATLGAATLLVHNETAAQHAAVAQAGLNATSFKSIRQEAPSESWLVLDDESNNNNNNSSEKKVFNISVMFELPILGWNVTQQNIIDAMTNKNTATVVNQPQDAKFFSIIVDGVPAAANISKILNASFEFRTMKRLGGVRTKYITGRKNFAWHDDKCVNQDEGFLLTLVTKTDSLSWLSSTGTQALLNTAHSYWLGGRFYDNRTRVASYMCWTSDPFFDPNLCSVGGSSSVNDDDNLLLRNSNQTLFTYASTASATSSVVGGLWCSRPPGLDCQHLDSPTNPIAINGSTTSLTSTFENYAPVLKYVSSAWRIVAVDVTSTADVEGSICCSLTDITTWTSSSSASSSNYFAVVQQNILLTEIVAGPPRLTPTRSNNISLSRSLSRPTEAVTESNTTVLTPTETHSRTNQTQSESPQPDVSSSFSQSVVPTSSNTHVDTPTLSFSKRTATVSKTGSGPSLSKSKMTPDETATYSGPSHNSPSATANETLTATMTAEHTVSTSVSAVSASMSESGSKGPPIPLVHIINQTHVVPFSALGPDFVGGRGEGDTSITSATAVAEQERKRPEKMRRIAWRIVQPPLLVFNVSTRTDPAKPCNLVSITTTTGGDSSNQQQEASSTTSSLTAFQKYAAAWFRQRFDFFVASPREAALLLPVVPDWATARALFGPEAGMHLLALVPGKFKPVHMKLHISPACFVGMTEHPPPTIKIEIAPPDMVLEPKIVAGEQVIFIARVMAFFIGPLIGVPHGAAQQISRSGFAMHVVQCVPVPSSGPSIIDYPLRFPVGDNGVLSEYMGAALGNMLLVFIFTVIGGFVAQVLVIQRGVASKAAKAMIRFPSAWMVVPAVLFYDVIARGASLVLFGSDSNAERGVGVIVVASILLLLLAGYNVLLSRVPAGAKCDLVYQRYKQRSAGQRSLILFLFGVWKWRDRLRSEKEADDNMDEDEEGALLRQQQAKLEESKRKQDADHDDDDDDDSSDLDSYDDTDDDDDDDDDYEQDGTRKHKNFFLNNLNKLTNTANTLLRGGSSSKKKKKRAGGGDDSKTRRRKTTQFGSVGGGESLVRRQRKERLRREAAERARTPCVPGFVHRNGRFFRAFNPKNSFFLIVELFLVGLVGFLSGIKSSKVACTASSIMYVVAIVAYFVALLWRRPYVSKFEFSFIVLFCVAQIAVGAALIFGFFAESHDALLHAVFIASILELLVCVKIVVDVILRVVQWKLHVQRLEDEAMAEQHRALLQAASELDAGEAAKAMKWYNPDAELMNNNGGRGGDDASSSDDDNDDDDDENGRKKKKNRRSRGDDDNNDENDDGFCLVDMDDVHAATDDKRQRALKKAIEKKAQEENLIVKCPVGLWEPDTLSFHCTRCNSEFTFTNRRHHCRACGKIYCGGCSPHMVTMLLEKKKKNNKNKKNSTTENDEDIGSSGNGGDENEDDEKNSNNQVHNQRCCIDCLLRNRNDVRQSGLEKMMATALIGEHQVAAAAAAAAALEDEAGALVDINHPATAENNNNAASSSSAQTQQNNNNNDNANNGGMPRMCANENWDHDEDYDMCLRCDAEFSIANRRHHCRACGRIYCSDCSSQMVSMLSYEGDRIILNQRCCVRCAPKKKPKKMAHAGDESLMMLLGSGGGGGGASFAFSGGNNSSFAAGSSSFAAASAAKKVIRNAADAEAQLQNCVSVWALPEKEMETVLVSSSSPPSKSVSNSATIDLSARPGITLDELFGDESSSSPPPPPQQQQQQQPKLSKRRQAAKNAESVTNHVLSKSANWLGSLRSDLGRSFDREEAILKEEANRDSGPGKGFLFKQYRGDGRKKKARFGSIFAFDEDDDDDDDDDGAFDHHDYVDGGGDDDDDFPPPPSSPTAPDDEQRLSSEASLFDPVLDGVAAPAAATRNVDDLFESIIASSSPSSTDRRQNPTVTKTNKHHDDAAISELNLFPPSHIIVITPPKQPRQEDRMSSTSPALSPQEKDSDLQHQQRSESVGGASSASSAPSSPRGGDDAGGGGGGGGVATVSGGRAKSVGGTASHQTFGFTGDQIADIVDTL